MQRVIIAILLLSLAFLGYSQQGYDLQILTSFPYSLHEVEVDMDGNFILCGGSNGTHIVKMDSEGNMLWDKVPYPGSWGYSGHTGMDVDSLNNIYYVDMRPPFNRFLYKLNPDGDSIKIRGLGNFAGQDTWTNDVEVVNSNRILVTKTANAAYPWPYYCILELLDSDLNNIDDWDDGARLAGRITVDQEQNIFVNGALEDAGYQGPPTFFVFDTLMNYQWCPSWDFMCTGNVVLLNDGSHLFSGYSWSGKLNISRFSSTGIQLSWHEYFDFSNETNIDVIRVNDSLCLTAIATYLDNEIVLFISDNNGDSLHAQNIPLPEGSLITGGRLKLFRHDSTFTCITNVLAGSKGGAILYFQMAFDSLEYLLPSPIPSPQAGFRYNQDINIVSFTDTSTHQEYLTSRLWDFGDGSTSEEKNPVHTYTSSGAFEVCLAVTGQKSDTSFYCDSVYSTLDIDAQTVGPRLSISYNPTGILTVKSNAPKGIDCLFRVIDETGAVKMKKDLQGLASGSRMLIDVSGLVPGFYVVQVITGREVVAGKIIIN